MNKSLKTLICAVLAAALLLPAVIYGAETSGNSSADAAATGESRSSESMSGDTAAPAENNGGSDVLEGNTGSTAAASAEEALPADGQADENEKKDILILYTSDIHCGVDEGFGYAGLEQIRKYEQKKGYEVILVDDGDNIQGDSLGILTKGEALIDLMNKMGYSVAIPGNHEFDYGMDQFLSLVEKAQFKYICCNFQYKGENVFDPYVIREIGGRKIGFVGVTTPETITSSTPVNFQDENGEFVYSFLQDKNGEAVYNAVQSAVDDARKEGAEYVIVLGHMGNDEGSRPWTYADVISHTNGIDAFLDGHSHDTEQVIMKNKDGKEIPRSACGTKMQCIGWCRIPVEGDVTAGIYTWTLDDPAPDMFGIENEMSEAVKAARSKIDVLLENKIAFSEQELTIYDPVAVDPEKGRVRMVRRAETNLGDLYTDACRVRMGADIAMQGSGGIRASIPAGDFTMKNVYEMAPFMKEVCVLEVTGQQILDALEWGSRSVPSENGCFQQVSGLTYEIHSYIDSTCTEDENGMFTGVAGERRVKNVKINGNPIDPGALYKMAGNVYWLLESGDGMTAFNGSKRLDSGGILEEEVFTDYITKDLGGVVGEEYSDLTGQGRIVIVEEKPAE